MRSLRTWLIAAPLAVLIAWGFWSVVDVPGRALLDQRARPATAAPTARDGGTGTTGDASRAAAPASSERRAEQPGRAARPDRPPRPIVAPRAARPRAWIFDELRRFAGTGSSVSLLRERAFAIAEDLDGFRDSFTPDAGGRTIDPLVPSVPFVPPPGSTLAFPAGCQLWRTQDWNDAQDWPQDLTVAGAGMDETLVRISAPIAARGALRSLTLRDLTIHCNDDGLTDLRSSEPATIRLLRCRVIGFDAGHGGCDLLDGNVGAMLAEESQIEMGYGRSPGFTELFDVRGGPCIVRMDRCAIVGPIDHTLFPDRSAQAFVLTNCELTDMRESLRARFEATDSNLRLRDCRITYVPDDTPPPEMRSVSRIVRGWTLPNVR